MFVDGQQNLAILIDLGAEGRIGPLCQTGKTLFGCREHPAAVAVAVASDRIRGEVVAQGKLKVLYCGLFELQFQRCLLFDQSGNRIVSLDLGTMMLFPGDAEAIWKVGIA